MLNELTLWIIFWIVIFIILFCDLYVTGQRRGRITLRASVLWSSLWIVSAFVFNVLIFLYHEQGSQKALQFLTGYLIEKSLSVDNLFVFLLIFKVMNVPLVNHTQVLKWGILGAIIFRIIFIYIGVELITLYHPIIYVFAFFLLYGAYKMAFKEEQKVNVDKNILVRIFRKIINILPGYCGKHFFVTKEGKIYATALFIPLLLIESSDIVFALDSIPAVIAITTDKFIIITSNVFAILGLRSLYFVLEGVVHLFIYLKYGISLILFYVGIKMVLSEIYEIPIMISLGVIVVCLTGAIISSLMVKNKYSSC